MTLSAMACPVCSEVSNHRLVERKWEFCIYRCNACTVEYADPIKTNINDPRARISYDRRFELVGSYIGWFHRTFLAQQIKAGGRLLELGCGTGDFIELARRNGYEAIGVDQDTEAVAAGRRYWNTTNIFPLNVEDYFQSQNSERFDVICMFEVLEHLDNPNSVLKSIQRFLEPNGYLVLSVPNNASSLQSLYRKLTRVIDYPPHHLLRWNFRSLETLLNRHGFEIVHQSTCTPTVSDMVSDLYKMYFPAKISTRVMNLFSSITARALYPVDRVLQHFATQGRSQMVIARRVIEPDQYL